MSRSVFAIKMLWIFETQSDIDVVFIQSLTSFYLSKLV